MLNDKLVLLWSGGLDSTGLMFVLLKKYDCMIYPIFVKHGQRNEKNEEYAISHYSKIFTNEKFHSRFKSPFIVSSDIPAKEFKKLNFEKRHLLRNSDLINNAVRYALYLNIKKIIIATTDKDLLDGQKNYLQKKEEEVNTGTEEDLKIFSPFFLDDFQYKSKKSIIDYCEHSGFDLTKTRSCYEDSEEPCGKCPSCQNREKAFADSVDF